MNAETRKAIVEFLDHTTEALRPLSRGMHVETMYVSMVSDLITPATFPKLVALLVATGRCRLEGERIYAV